MDGENHVLPDHRNGWATEHLPSVPQPVIPDTGVPEQLAPVGPAGQQLARPSLTPGRTVISETAVAKVAGVAARSVDGVHALGAGSARALSAIRDAVGSTDLTQGVRAEVGETQVAVDINLVAEYGTPLQELANRVRAAVYAAVEALVGLQVIEVNIEVTDVHVAGYEPEKALPRPRLSERLGVQPGAAGAPKAGNTSAAEKEIP